jgi:primosomal protein N'
MHGAKSTCPRCDIDAVLSVVSGRVKAGFSYLECFACDHKYGGDDYDRCPECGFKN